MKQFFAFILAGVIGGLISFTIIKNQIPTFSPDTNSSPRAILTANEASVNLQAFNFVKAAKTVTPAVVHIEAGESKALAQQRNHENRQRSPFDGLFDFELFGPQFYGPKNGTGSGVIISHDGYIVTNNHVVGYADDITVSLPDKRKFQAVKVGTDPSTDLALLKIEADDLIAIEFSNSDEVRVGEWVAAIGNPFSYLKSTVTAGIVSAKGRDIDIIQGDKAIEEFIQTDAAINPGNSGGALVNTDGKLIGINTAIATPTGVFAGYSFAIPSNLVQHIVKEIKENGDIQRAVLGIEGDTVDPELIDDRNLKIDSGFYVAKVRAASAAELSGVLPGDVIIGANGKVIETYEDLVGVMEFAKVGDTIDLRIQRKNKVKDIRVKLRKGI